MSYKAVGAQVASVALQSGNKVNLHTKNVNTDTFEYEEIDYSQAVEPDTQVEEYKENIEPTKLSYAEEVKGLLNILNKELDDINNKIKPLQSEYDSNYTIITHPVFFNPNNVNSNALANCERIRPELDALKGEKAMLESYIYQLEQELALAPYKDIADTKGYKDFIKNYNNNYQNIDYDLLADCRYDPVMYIMEQSRGKSRAELDAMLANRENQIDKLAIVEHLIEIAPKDKDLDFLTTFYVFLTDDFINYQFMTEDQRNMYHYLFATKGEDAANEYLNVISDSINQAHGAKLAADFVSTLDLNDKGKLEKSLANFFGVSTKGLSDGIDTFFTGINNVFVNNDKLTAEEYEKMIVLKYLQDNSNYYDEIYTFNSALGNMIPSMATSAVVSALATPAAGAITGSALMGTSAGGNAKHQALVEGNSLLSSCLYGIFIGSSEATLGYFLGKIPGISQTSGFTLKNLLCEGTEEFLQEWIDAGLQTVILGKDVDWSEIPEQSVDSFIMGVLMAGFLNGGQAIVNISINGRTVAIDVEETLKYMEQHPDVDFEGAFAAVNKSFSIGKKRNIVYELKALDSFFEYYNRGGNSRYGVNQGYIDSLYTYEVNGVYYDSKRFNWMKKNGKIPADAKIVKKGGDEYFRLKDLLIKKGFSRHGASMVMSGLDSSGACSYAAIANCIFSQFKNDPQGFYNTFGYNMHIKNTDGSWSLNSGELLIDLYTFCNNEANGGHMFRTNPNTGKIEVLNIGAELDALGRVQLDSSGQRYMSGQKGINDQFIINFLKSKNPNIEFQSQQIHKNINPNVQFTDQYIKIIKNDVINAIKGGFHVQLGLMQGKSTINMISLTEGVPNTSTSVWSEGGGHATYVTDVCNEGLIVSSWGNKYLIPFADLQNGGLFTIDIVGISVNPVDPAAANAFDLALNAMIKKYGKTIAIQQLQGYLDTGKLELITSTDGARQALRNVSLERVRTYVKSINNGSLDVNLLIR